MVDRVARIIRFTVPAEVAFWDRSDFQNNHSERRLVTITLTLDTDPYTNEPPVIQFVEIGDVISGSDPSTGPAFDPDSPLDPDS
jgi:hypothetical protein